MSSKETSTVSNLLKKSSIPSRFVYTFAVILLVWTAFTETLESTEIAVGIVISLAIATFSWKIFTQRGLKNLHPKRILYAIIYSFYMFYAMLKANLDVAYRVLHPKMPINPGFVIVKTKLKSPLAKAVLGNSITLTPGTMTLDYYNDEMIIHWLTVKSEDEEKASNEICRPFERFLEVFLE